MPKSSSASRTPVARSADRPPRRGLVPHDGELGDLELQLPRRQLGEIHHSHDLGRPARPRQLDRRDVDAHVRRPRTQLPPPCRACRHASVRTQRPNRTIAPLAPPPRRTGPGRAARARDAASASVPRRPAPGRRPGARAVGSAAGTRRAPLPRTAPRAARPGPTRRRHGQGRTPRRAPSLRLGPRQRHVRRPPDIGRCGRPRARHRDADTRGDLHGAPAQPEREGQRLLDAARHEFDRAGVDDVFDEHRELVAAVADDQVGSDDLCSRIATSTSSRSPRSWPSASFTAAKPSRSTTHRPR